MPVLSHGVIPFASRKISTLLDGTLRLQVDIEPIHAQAAFALFSSPGTPGAIARLTNEAAQAATVIAPNEKSAESPSKIATGLRCREAVGLMKEKDFSDYVKFVNMDFNGNDTPKEFVQIMCGIVSRREFDEGPDADKKYALFCGVKKKYREWQGNKGQRAREALEDGK